MYPEVGVFMQKIEASKLMDNFKNYRIKAKIPGHPETIFSEYYLPQEFAVNPHKKKKTGQSGT